LCVTEHKSASNRANTGGEFSVPLPLAVLLAAEGPRTVAEASLPAADAHEQMANPEFATSVTSFDGQLRLTDR